MKPSLLSDFICIIFSLLSWYCDKRFYLVPLCYLISWQNICVCQFLLGWKTLLSWWLYLLETSPKFSFEKNDRSSFDDKELRLRKVKVTCATLCNRDSNLVLIHPTLVKKEVHLHIYLWQSIFSLSLSYFLHRTCHNSKLSCLLITAPSRDTASVRTGILSDTFIAISQYLEHKSAQ